MTTRHPHSAQPAQPAHTFDWADFRPIRPTRPTILSGRVSAQPAHRLRTGRRFRHEPGLTAWRGEVGRLLRGMPTAQTAVLDPDAYERQARKELRDWRAKMLRGPNAFDRAALNVQGRINAVIPEAVHKAVTAVIERMTRAVLAGADYTSAPPLLHASLQHREDRVRRVLAAYRNGAAVEGGVAGAGGFVLAAADFPALVAIKLKMLFDVAALYGRDTDDFSERLHVLHVFQLAFSSAGHRHQVMTALEGWDRAHARPETFDGFDWRTFQREYRDYIDIAKLAQRLPVVGAPIGAVVNWRLLSRLGQAAVGAHRMRWLEGGA